jgi:mRNA-degrading endonuclease toxin of MazEF toxin-antitoxin module
MPAKCVVNLDDILTVPRSKLTERITSLPASRMMEVAEAVIFALDIRM